MINEIWSIIIATVPSVIAVMVYIKNKELTKKINKVNLENGIYMEIFKNYLLEDLPNARNALFIDINKNVKDYQEMTKSLRSLKRSALYFDYRNKEFYKVLKEKANILEDYLVKSEGKEYEGTEATEFFQKVDTYMRDLYSHIINGSFGED